LNISVLSRERAEQMDKKLAQLLDATPEEVRAYLDHQFGPRSVGGQRVTGWTFKRGTHGGHYIRDPGGTDILPSGYQAA
jgi:hypothetical protein